MKLTPDIIQVLKTFSDINPNILLEPNQVIRTVSPNKTVLAEYTPSSPISITMGIFDLPKFLSVCRMLGDSPEVVIDPKNPHNAKIRGDSGTVNYRLSPENMLTITKKSVKAFPAFASFNLDKKELDAIRNASSVLKASTVSFSSDGQGIVVTVFNATDANGANRSGSEDSYVFRLTDESNTSVFDYQFSVDNLPSFSGSYDVKIAEKTISQFSHTNGKLNYWIATSTKAE